MKHQCLQLRSSEYLMGFFVLYGFREGHVGLFRWHPLNSGGGDARSVAQRKGFLRIEEEPNSFGRDDVFHFLLSPRRRRRMPRRGSASQRKKRPSGTYFLINHNGD